MKIQIRVCFDSSLFPIPLYTLATVYKWFTSVAVTGPRPVLMPCVMLAQNISA